MTNCHKRGGFKQLQNHTCRSQGSTADLPSSLSSWRGRPNPAPRLVVSSLQPLPPPCVSAFSSQKDPILGHRVQCEPILTSTKTRLPNKVASELPSGCEFGRHASFPQQRTLPVPRTLAPELTGGWVGGGTAHCRASLPGSPTSPQVAPRSASRLGGSFTRPTSLKTPLGERTRPAAAA